MIRRAYAVTLVVTLLCCRFVLAADDSFAFTHVNVVDVAGGTILPDRTVVVSRGRIAAITPGGKTPSVSKVISAAGQYLMPGMWDMHAHIEMTGESFLPLYVASGVTGIRDMGSEVNLILRLREQTRKERTPGPTIFAAGPILDDAPGDWEFRMRVKTAEEGRAAVRALKRRGVDFIKVHDHTPREVYFAIAEEARKQKLRLAGHLPLKVSLQEAIAAGQGDIEHLINMSIWQPCSGGAEYRSEPCRATFEELASRRIWQTPTLAFWAEMAFIGTPGSRMDPRRLAYVSSSQMPDPSRRWRETAGSRACRRCCRQRHGEGGSPRSDRMRRHGRRLVRAGGTRSVGARRHEPRRSPQDSHAESARLLRHRARG
jgi:hypothetical protein